MDGEKPQSPADSAQAAAQSQTYTESTTVYDMMAWIDANRRNIVLGVVLVLGLAATFAVYAWWKGENELKANGALLGLPGSSLGMAATNANPESFFKVASDYAGTESAVRAQVIGAQTLYNQGKFAEAQAAFAKVGDSTEFDSIKATAAYGVAASLDALGKTNDALAQYADVANRYPTQGVASLAKISQGRIHEAAGRNDQALRIYEELSRNVASDIWAQEAQSRRQDLLTRHPELAKTLPAVATPPAAAPAPITVAPGK